MFFWASLMNNEQYYFLCILGKSLQGFKNIKKIVNKEDKFFCFCSFFAFIVLLKLLYMWHYHTKYVFANFELLFAEKLNSKKGSELGH